MPDELVSSEKTPIAALHEFCMQNDGFLTYDYVPHETDPKWFSCIAQAFDMHAKGSGRSKKVAKHDACAKLIVKLSNLNRFKQTIQKVPVIPRPTCDGDAVIALRDICVQRNYPLPTFDEMQSGGQPHAPVFTYVCQVASIKRTGTFSTKKGAKQIATRAVIDVLQKFKQNEEQMQIATVDADQNEGQRQVENDDDEPLPTYNKLKESQSKLWAPRLRDRHNYFLQLPKEHRIEAEKILMDDSPDMKSRDKVDQACTALKLKYNVIDVPNHEEGLKIFHLRGNYDCVIAAKEIDLYNRVIDYFKTMLNLQRF